MRDGYVTVGMGLGEKGALCQSHWVNGVNWIASNVR